MKTMTRAAVLRATRDQWTDLKKAGITPTQTETFGKWLAANAVDHAWDLRSFFQSLESARFLDRLPHDIPNMTTEELNRLDEGFAEQNGERLCNDLTEDDIRADLDRHQLVRAELSRRLARV